MVLNDFFYRFFPGTTLVSGDRVRNVYVFCRYSFFNNMDRLFPYFYIWRDRVMVSRFKSDTETLKVNREFLLNNSLVNDYIFSKNIDFVAVDRFNLRLNKAESFWKSFFILVPSVFVFLNVFYSDKLTDEVYLDSLKQMAFFSAVSKFFRNRGNKIISGLLFYSLKDQKLFFYIDSLSFLSIDTPKFFFMDSKFRAVKGFYSI